jgi:serine/threonine protein kinase
MTLYRLLHGETWYEESPDPRNTIREGNFADSLRWLPHIPKDWRRVIRKMLCDDPAGRYQSAQQALNGIASLSIDPSWEAEVTPHLIEWNRVKGQRRIRAERERLSDRRHRWRAWSEPLKRGRDRSFGDSNGIVGRRQAEAGLREFLCP